MDVLEEFCDSCAIWRIAFIVAKMTENRKEHVCLVNTEFRITSGRSVNCKQRPGPNQLATNVTRTKISLYLAKILDILFILH